ncbi:MAG: hypothetical protein ACEPOW_07555 [Bacteroidales bacterium]
MKYFFVFFICLFLLSCEFVPTASNKKPKESVQRLNLNKGWNAVSFFVLPDQSPRVDSIFGSIQQELIQVEGYAGANAGVYNPSRINNSFDRIEANRAYLVDVVKHSTLTLSGDNFALKNVLLNSSVHNNAGMKVGYFPVPGDKPYYVDDLDISSIDSLVLIYDLRGGIYWPKYNINSLGLLFPGKSYFFAFYGTIDCSLAEDVVFHELKSSNLPLRPAGLPNTWGVDNYTPYFHFLLFSTDNFKPYSNGDFLGAFTQEGECAGLQILDTNKKYTAIPLFKDDLLDNVKNGFYEGESIEIRLFRQHDQSIHNYTIFPKKNSDKKLNFHSWEIDTVAKIMEVN